MFHRSRKTVPPTDQASHHTSNQTDHQAGNQTSHQTGNQAGERWQQTLRHAVTRTWYWLRYPFVTLGRRLWRLPKQGVNPWLGLLFYGVLFAHISTHTVSPALDTWMHVGLALLLVVHAGFTTAQRAGLYACLAILPALQVVFLLARAETISETSWALLLVYFLLVGVLTVRRALAYEHHAVGLALIGKRGNNWLQHVAWGIFGLLVQLVIAVAGALVLARLWALYPLASPLLEASGTSINAVTISLLFFAGLAEEWYFRGLFQRAARDAAGWAAGLLMPALITGMVYLLWHNPLLALLQVTVGLLLGLVMYASGSALGVSVAKGLANISLLMSFSALWRYVVDTSMQVYALGVQALDVARGLLERFL